MDSQDSPGPSPESPRFGIRHMLLWAVCLAALMPLAKRAVDRSQGGDTALRAGQWIITALQMSAALMALPILVARRSRGSRFPELPGERYWLICGIMMPAVLIIGSLRWYSSMRLVLALSLVWLGLLLHAVWRVGRGPWRWFFCIEAARVSLVALCWFRRELAAVLPYEPLLLPLADAIPGWILTLLPSVAGLVCVAIDHRRGRRYPWTHWWGVGLLLAEALQVLWIFVRWQ